MVLEHRNITHTSMITVNLRKTFINDVLKYSPIQAYSMLIHSLQKNG